jgi:hypothetical protein
MTTVKVDGPCEETDIGLSYEETDHVRIRWASKADKALVLDIGRDIVRSGPAGRLKHAARLLAWIFDKKAHGLKVERSGDTSWTVIVP